MGNADSPYGIDRADELRNNKQLYEDKIRYFTKKYADSTVSGQTYDSDWDFTYNP